jgi:3-dehydroquinate dehydratase / shikimate dehydrogenase
VLFVSLKSLILPHCQADGFELRLDYLTTLNINEIAEFCAQLNKPIILALRKTSHGGHFAGTDQEGWRLLEKLSELKTTTFVDLEHDTPPSFLKEIKTPILLSYHNFEYTPDNLDALLESLSSPYPYAYKIATMAKSSCDALRMLLFVKKHAHRKICGLCMGEKGILTRILGPVYGSFINYACLNEAIAPGQLTINELRSIYHYDLLNQHTTPYGLIGDPVSQSIGHIVHNRMIREEKRNAVYVKTPVSEIELPPFLRLAHQLGFKGLSVTAPLKEAILPHLDHLDPNAQAIGAVNTVLFKERGLEGHNTDGKGAIESIKKQFCLNGKKIIILGSGGAARAIAYEALQQGARVTLLNRTVERARNLAIKLSCQWGALEDLKQDYDLIINSTTSPMPIDPSCFHSGAVAMDISISPSPFLAQAQKKGCFIISGSDMWHCQALRQRALYFNNKE